MKSKASSKKLTAYQNAKIRKDFPFLEQKIFYLDNAATTQKPKAVIDALDLFYTRYNANTHRGVYKSSEKATAMVENSRKIFADFINARPDEIIFVKNATEGFNQIATSITRTFIHKKEHKYNIVCTEIEHHSNFVPWQQLAIRMDIGFRVVRYDRKNNVLDDIAKHVDNNTLLVAFSAMSNATGVIIDARDIIKRIREKNDKTIIIVDATQAVAHEKVDVRKLDCDFLCFSAHKIYGTLGVGIVYGKKSFLENIAPFFYGGNMIKNVEIHSTEFAEGTEKFEAGTQDAAGIIASSKAVSYIEKIGFGRISQIESGLKEYALERLRTIPGIKIIGHEKTIGSRYGPIISFVIEGIHPHDLASICDRHEVCIRAGHHCAQPLMKALGVAATSRISISFYNTKEDIDRLYDAIISAIKLLK